MYASTLSDFFLRYTTELPSFNPDSWVISKSSPLYIVRMIEGLRNSLELCFGFMNKNKYVPCSGGLEFHCSPSDPYSFDRTGAVNRSGQHLRLGNLTNPGMFLKAITLILHVRGVKYRRLSK
jgi:hypothetical protein